MKPLTVIASLTSIFLISWIPAQWWNSSSSPWCLHYIPDWVDKSIYSIIHPLLSEDIGKAAEQMDFIEVWIFTSAIMTVLILTVIIAYKYRHGKAPL